MLQHDESGGLTGPWAGRSGWCEVALIPRVFYIPDDVLRMDEYEKSNSLVHGYPCVINARPYPTLSLTKGLFTSPGPWYHCTISSHPIERMTKP